MRKYLAWSTSLYFLAVGAATVGVSIYVDRVDAYLKPHEDSSLAGLAYALPLASALIGLLPLVLTAVALLFKRISRKVHLLFGALILACHGVASCFYVLSLPDGSSGWHLTRPWLALAIVLHGAGFAALIWGAARTQERSRAV